MVSALVDAGPVGEWAAEQIVGADLLAPALLPFECANILRRHELAGLLGADQAAQAHADLVALAVELWPYDVLASGVWSARHNLTCYDGAYVALAELSGAPLLTLDRRLQRAVGPRCTVRVPPPDA